MNKKAVAVLAIAGLAFLVAVILFFNKTINITPGPDARYLGDTEIKVWNAYIDSDKQLLYMDMAARYAFHKASYIAIGGTETQQLPNDNPVEFMTRFSGFFSQYLDEFNRQYNLDLSIMNYTFTLDSKGLKGICNREIVLAKEPYEYKFKPSFRVEFNTELQEETVLDKGIFTHAPEPSEEVQPLLPTA